MKQSTKLLAAFLAVVFLAGLFAPTASAQTQRPSTFTITTATTIANPIEPDIKPQAVTIGWKYTVGQGGQLGFGESTTATLDWETPTCDDDQIFVTGPLAQTIDLQPEGQETAITRTGDAQFEISATTDAPGEVSLTCTFEAKVLAVGNSIEQSNSDSRDIPFTVDYYGLIQAKTASRLKESGPQKTISYDVEVTNFGNARTNVAFSLGSETSGGWEPIVPEPLILESKVSGQGGDVQTATLQISTPYKNGWNNDDKTFKLVLTPTSAKTGKEGGNPVEVNVLARVRGVYVPSLEPFVLVGAVIGAGLLARRLQE